MNSSFMACRVHASSPSSKPDSVSACAANFCWKNVRYGFLKLIQEENRFWMSNLQQLAQHNA